MRDFYFKDSNSGEVDKIRGHRVHSKYPQNRWEYIKKGPIDMGPVPKLTAYEKTYSILYIRLHPEKKGSLRHVKNF